MTFTTSDLNNLKAALLTGAKRVQIGDRIVEYREQKDILAAIKMVEDYLAGEDLATDVNPNVITAGYSRGES